MFGLATTVLLMTVLFDTPPMVVSFSTSVQPHQRHQGKQLDHQGVLDLTRLLAVTKEASSTSTATQSTATATATTPIPTYKIGDWEELHGNFVLRPPSGTPRALIHFLGGALVGSAPHVSYRYVLERLAREGYLVVATPYELSFDHLATCDAVLARFETIAGQLARTYGALPVVGIGHSCGALLQVLITSLFPDTPRAANALLSFNNKPITEAVPVFEEVVVPFFTYAAALNDTARPSASEVLTLGLQMAQTTVAGQLPTDQQVQQAVRLLTEPLLQNSDSTSASSVSIPPPLREAFARLAAPPTNALAAQGDVIPLTLQVLRALEQIPLLIDEVALGARDFVPPPSQVKEATQRAYRARRTLLISYADDPLDESETLQESLSVAGQIAAMKRPLLGPNVQTVQLPGGHAAPLLAPPLELAEKAQDWLGVDSAQERLAYTQAEATVRELVRWLEEGNL